MNPSLSRRDWLRLTSAGVVGWSFSGWLETLAADIARHPQRRRACILLWMNGGPSQMDTFDLKPGHANGGTYRPIATSVPGIHISEHLPRIARWMRHMAIVRSMSTMEGDHTRAAYYLRTGYKPVGAIQFPTLGSVLSKELGDDNASLPNFVSIASETFLSPAAYEPGFLGPRYAPLMVANRSNGGSVDYRQALRVEDISPASDVTTPREDARLQLVRDLERDFRNGRPDMGPRSHVEAYDRAVRLMRTTAARAFTLDEESSALRDAYGRNLFGQGCLLARRLVERGVPFIEVTLGGVDGMQIGWDTHLQNFDMVARLSKVLDAGWSTLMEDLKDRGLLDTTLVVWMGEFGRTPQINPQGGRDHFPNAWSTVLAGGGIKGGQAYGRTSPDGATVADRPVHVPDFLATVCKALGVDPMKQNPSNVGRPIRIADPVAKSLAEVIA